MNVDHFTDNNSILLLFKYVIEPIKTAAIICCTHTHTSITGYAPIRFYGNTRVDFTLDYSFFYDLELQRTQVGGVTREDIDVGPGPGKKRRRRQMAGTDSEPEETIQSVNISFRPVEVSNGVLLYSRTRSSVHLLKVCVNVCERVYVFTAW